MLVTSSDSKSTYSGAYRGSITEGGYGRFALDEANSEDAIKAYKAVVR